jgi:hypothetical protein
LLSRQIFFKSFRFSPYGSYPVFALVTESDCVASPADFRALRERPYTALEIGTMKRRRLFEALTVALLAVLMIAGGLVLAAPPDGKGGGKNNDGDGGGDGSATPAVQYEVVWLGTLGGSSSGASAANTFGEIVGYSYDSSGTKTGVRFSISFGPIDLNEEMSELIAAHGDGKWFVWSASDINELGQVTGTIVGSDGFGHPYIYDPAAPSLEILGLLHGDHTYGVSINNFGEVLGAYDGNGGGAFVQGPGGSQNDLGPRLIGLESSAAFNDAGQVVLNSDERYTPPGSDSAELFEAFPFHLNSINRFGDVAGFTRTAVSKRKSVTTIYRASTPGSEQAIYEGDSANWPVINAEGDVCFGSSSRLLLHREGIGIIDLDSLVVGTEDAVTKWQGKDHARAYHLLDPAVDATGKVEFPIAVGSANLPGLGVNEAFVLLRVRHRRPSDDRPLQAARTDR